MCYSSFTEVANDLFRHGASDLINWHQQIPVYGTLSGHEWDYHQLYLKNLRMVI